MLKSIPYYSPPRPGDIVLIAATPFVDWLREIDFARDPEFFKFYRYDLLPARSDHLDRWLWAKSRVVQIEGCVARLRSPTLGEANIPIHCLRVLESTALATSEGKKHAKTQTNR